MKELDENLAPFFIKVSIELLFAYLLTYVAKEIFNDNRREYGNGLKKFEPNDLNKSKILDLSMLNACVGKPLQLDTLIRCKKNKIITQNGLIVMVLR